MEMKRKKKVSKLLQERKDIREGKRTERKRERIKEGRKRERKKQECWRRQGEGKEGTDIQINGKK